MCIAPSAQLVNRWSEPYRIFGMLSKHDWLFIHYNRQFPLAFLFQQVGANTHRFVDIGTEITIDELQTNFSGDSPVLNFNQSKPHEWGHLIHQAAVKINNRSIIIATAPRLPDFHGGHPAVHEVVSHIDSQLEDRGRVLHYIMDSWFNTKGTRELLVERNRCYTMVGKTNNLPHMWRTLQFHLPFNEWRQKFHPTSNVLCVSFHSFKKTNTMSNAFTPIPALITPAQPPIYQVYRSSFNLIDLFDRVYFSIVFPHR